MSIDYRQELINLLCRIHRDGGHYIAEHGERKAIDDADLKVAFLNAMSDGGEPVAFVNGQYGGHFTYRTVDPSVVLPMNAALYLSLQPKHVSAAENGGKTGWPPGLLQDDNRKLAQWFAGKPDAKYVLRKALCEL